jgi:hypothetical protein
MTIPFTIFEPFARMARAGKTRLAAQDQIRAVRRSKSTGRLFACGVH